MRKNKQKISRIILGKMIVIAKTGIKNLFKAIGLKIQKIPDSEKNKYLWLKEYNISTVIDVGANEGQFALDIRQYLPEAIIYSLEPLKDCFKILKSRFKGDEKFFGFCVALGDKNENMDIYRSEFSPSSSILEMADIHKDAFPYTKGLMKEKISVETLDNFIENNNIELVDNVLLKLDVQGYEDKVLKGSEKTLGRIKVILTEVSFVELYKRQVLFEDIYTSLKSNGFKFYGCNNLLSSPKNGFPLQADAIFIKSD